MKHEEMRAKMEQEKADRLEAQKQKAAETRAMMLAKKMEAAKAVEEALAKRSSMSNDDQIPRTDDVIAEAKAKAAEAIAAKKAAGGPSKVQIALEKARAEYQKKVEEHKKMLPKTPDKDLKYLKDTKQQRDSKMKKLGATDQDAKEKLALEQQKKAEALKKKLLSELHYNRK